MIQWMVIGWVVGLFTYRALLVIRSRIIINQPRSAIMDTVMLRLPMSAAERMNRLMIKTQTDNSGMILSNALRLFEAMIVDDEADTSWFRKLKTGEIQPFLPFKTSS